MPIIIFQNIRQSFIDMIGYPIRAGTMKPLGGELDEDLHLKPNCCSVSGLLELLWKT